MNKTQLATAVKNNRLVSYKDGYTQTAARVLDADGLWTNRSYFGGKSRFSRSAKTRAIETNYELTGYLVLSVAVRYTRDQMTPEAIAAAEEFLATTTLTTADLFDANRHVDYSKLPENIRVNIVNPRDLSVR